MDNQLQKKEPKRVPKDTAIQETENWRSILKPVMGDKVIRGFFIPIEDITAIANMHQVSGMRGYICLTDKNDFSSISFIVVPVDENNKDILTEKNGVSEEEISTIYDFTRPCPAFCDESSPLYSG
ncbi:MAG: hypothetical protein KGZ74_05085 [Chitinophagaceae bacterium]|nr:hypothetical protein [Chitinophagaceae bacterium]